MNELFLFVRPPRPMWPFNGPSSSFWPPLAFASMAAMLLFVPAASLSGNGAAWYALAALAPLGLASLALLVAANLALSIAWLARRLLHLHPA